MSDPSVASDPSIHSGDQSWGYAPGGSAAYTPQQWAQYMQMQQMGMMTLPPQVHDVEVPMILTGNTDHIDELQEAIQRGRGDEIMILTEIVRTVNRILESTQPCEACGSHAQSLLALPTFEDKTYRMLCQDCQDHCPRCHYDVGDGLGYAKHAASGLSVCYPCSKGQREEANPQDCRLCRR
jgi:hypothetical protein